MKKNKLGRSLHALAHRGTYLVFSQRLCWEAPPGWSRRLFHWLRDRLHVEIIGRTNPLYGRTRPNHLYSLLEKGDSHAKR